MRRNGLVILFILFAAGGLLAASLGLVPLPFNLGDDKPVTAAKPEAPGPGERAAHPTPKGAGFGAPTEQANGSSTPTQATGTTIDITRISPDGGSVFAGHAEPNSYVTIFEDGKPVASGKADGEGEWSLVTDHKFASVDPNLSVKAGAEPGPKIAAADTGTAERQAETPPAAPTATEPSKETAAAGAAKAVAADLMSKFEALVAQARKDAESEGKAADASSAPSSATVASSELSGARPEEPTAVAAAATPADPRADAAKTHAPAAEPAKLPRPTAGTPLTVPVPIMFVYNEPTLTDEGRYATSLLLEYVKLKHLDTVALSGHADERGSGEYNMDLSRERLDTVARLLRDGGFSGKLDLAAKGETEPFTGIDRSKYTGEALYQLDRRVELHLTQ